MSIQQIKSGVIADSAIVADKIASINAAVISAGTLAVERLSTTTVIQSFRTTVPEVSISNANSHTLFNLSFTPKISGSRIFGYANWVSCTGPVGGASNSIELVYNLGTNATPTNNSTIQTSYITHWGTDAFDNGSHLHLFTGTTSSTSTHYASCIVNNNAGSAIVFGRHSAICPIFFFELAP